MWRRRRAVSRGQGRFVHRQPLDRPARDLSSQYGQLVVPAQCPQVIAKARVVRVVTVGQVGFVMSAASCSSRHRDFGASDRCGVATCGDDALAASLVAVVDVVEILPGNQEIEALRLVLHRSGWWRYGLAIGLQYLDRLSDD